LPPGRFIEAASIARFTSVIEPLPETAPSVRIARVLVPVGAIAADTLIPPVLFPFNSPIRKVPAWIRLISSPVRESLPIASLPRSISCATVAGAMVTTPAVAETVVPKSIELAFSKTLPVLEVIEAVLAIELPEISIWPPLDTRFAPTVIVEAFTLKSPATEMVELAPFEMFPAVEVSVRPAPAVELEIALLTVTLPVASKVAVEAVVSWFWTEVGVTLDAEALSVYQVPLIQTPVVSRAVVDETVTAEGILLVFTVSTNSLKPVAV
jgi:hypothetical protein